MPNTNQTLNPMSATTPSSTSIPTQTNQTPPSANRQTAYNTKPIPDYTPDPIKNYNNHSATTPATTNIPTPHTQTSPAKMPGYTPDPIKNYTGNLTRPSDSTPSATTPETTNIPVDSTQTTGTSTNDNKPSPEYKTMGQMGDDAYSKIIQFFKQMYHGFADPWNDPKNEPDKGTYRAEPVNQEEADRRNAVDNSKPSTQQSQQTKQFSNSQTAQATQQNQPKKQFSGTGAAADTDAFQDTQVTQTNQSSGSQQNASTNRNTGEVSNPSSNSSKDKPWYDNWKPSEQDKKEYNQIDQRRNMEGQSKEMTDYNKGLQSQFDSATDPRQRYELQQRMSNINNNQQNVQKQYNDNVNKTVMPVVNDITKNINYDKFKQGIKGAYNTTKDIVSNVVDPNGEYNIKPNTQQTNQPSSSQTAQAAQTNQPKKHVPGTGAAADTDAF